MKSFATSGPAAPRWKSWKWSRKRSVSPFPASFSPSQPENRLSIFSLQSPETPDKLDLTMSTATMSPGKALSILRSAIVNARIYPKGSQMIDASLKGAHQALEACLQENLQMIISDIQGKLCVGGKEVSEARDFRPFMVQHEVQSLIVSRGLTLEEVTALIDGLGRRKGQLDSHKSLGDWLQANAVT